RRDRRRLPESPMPGCPLRAPPPHIHSPRPWPWPRRPRRAAWSPPRFSRKPRSRRIRERGRPWLISPWLAITSLAASLWQDDDEGQGVSLSSTTWTPEERILP